MFDVTSSLLSQFIKQHLTHRQHSRPRGCESVYATAVRRHLRQNTRGQMSIQAYLGRRLPHIFPLSSPVACPHFLPSEPPVTARHKHSLPLNLSLPLNPVLQVQALACGIFLDLNLTTLPLLSSPPPHHLPNDELHRQPLLRQGRVQKQHHRKKRPQSCCSTLHQLQISPTHHHQILSLFPTFTSQQQHRRPLILDYHGASFRW